MYGEPATPSVLVSKLVEKSLLASSFAFWVTPLSVIWTVSPAGMFWPLTLLFSVPEIVVAAAP